MGALLRLVALGAIIWFIYRTLVRSATTAAVKAVTENPPGGGTTVHMRKCAYCGLHIPEGESTQSRGQFFCSEAHRDAWLAGQTQ
jgi:uncharacterized protein